MTDELERPGESGDGAGEDETERAEQPTEPRVYKGVEDSFEFVAAMMAELTGEPVDPQRFAWMRDLSVEQVDLYIRLHEQEGLSHERALEEINKMSQEAD
jgi:hypothetical protein